MNPLPALVKVFLIFIFILVINRFKVDLGLSIIVGTFLLGLSFGMNALQTLAAMAKSFADPLTVLLLLLVTFDLTMNQLMDTSGQMKRMVEYFSKMVTRTRVSLAAMPAFIGLLPMPGGAYFSAPMVDAMSQKLDMTAELKTMVNYWFRHLWEYWWPMYPGVILAVTLTGLSMGKFMLMQSVYTVATIAIGYFILLRRVPNDADTAAPDYSRATLRGFTGNALPILTVIGGMFILSLAAPLWKPYTGGLGEASKYLPMLVGLIAANIITVCTNRFTMSEIRKTLFNKKIGSLILLILALMAYKYVLSVCGAIKVMNQEMVAYHIPLLLVIIVLPFISGMVMGISMGFVGASFPIILSLVAGKPHLAAYVTLAYGAGYMGMMLSPIHFCLVLTRDYFCADFSKVYRYLVPACAAMSLVILVWFLVLRYAF
ncbi:MAG: DUF401 family protein [Fibrobacterota bacterium]